MKTITKTITAVLMLLLFAEAEAQLTADAGANQTICAGNPTTIGGSPTVSGGSAPYTYIWSPSASLSSTSVGNPLASPTVTTKYFVLVTDALSNTALDSVTITVNQNPVIDSFTTTNVSCFGGNDGSLCVNVSGGTGNITYAWNMLQTVQCPIGLSAGNHSVTVTDANNCTVWDSITITQPTQLTLSETHTDVLCNGDPTGTIDLIVTGGTAPYNYLWTNTVITQDQINLSAGLYNVTVTDINGCTAGLTVTITEPTALSATTSHTDVTCYGANDGTITVNISGGTPPYTYLGSPVTAGTTVIPNLAPAAYGGNIVDANGCSVAVSETVIEPFQLIATETHVNVVCNGSASGSIDVTVAGGTPGYFYGWSTTAITQDLTNLVVGIYTVTVSDANFCSATITVTITEPAATIATITKIGDGILPDTLSASISSGCVLSYNWSGGVSTQQNIISSYGNYTITIVDCNICTATAQMNVLASSITVTYPNGGENLVVGQNVTLTWNSTAVSQVKIEFYSSISFTWITLVSSIVNTGTYNLTVPNVAGTQGKIKVTDVSNASIFDESDALFNIVAGSLTATVNAIDITCNGAANGSVVVTATGGTSPYQFSIDNGITFQGSNTFSNLGAGNYSVIVHDGASGADTVSFAITEPALLQIDSIVIYQNVSCYGGNDGSACFFASGGTPPYTYTMGPITVPCYVALVAGNYVAVVTDGRGCQVDSSYTITQSLTEKCVWPGDADANGLVDNDDLLSIGLGYGISGTPRTVQDIYWYGHGATNWIDTLASGTNYKHIDCDGNGTINANDTLAIIQNYGQVHAKTDDMAAWRSAIPALYIDLVPDTSRAGDTLIGYLSLGDTAIPVSNLYGLAFTVNYDPNVVDSSKTSAAFGNSWLGTATDKISIAKDLKLNGQLKCAITRIDHATRSGSGQIGQVSFVITTDNINGSHLSYYNMHVWLSDITMIDNNGNILDVNPGQDSSQVEFEPTGIGEVQNSKFNLQINPNPASDAVRVIVSEELVTGRMIVLDMEGRVATDMVISTSNFKLETLPTEFI